MKLVYDINQKPPLKKNLVYAFQQLLAIMAATLLVPVLADSTGLYLNQPAALFDDVGCVRIVLDTNLTNLRAQHVYERLGFERQGMRKDCWLDQLGNLQSAVDYSLTRERFVSFIV